MTPGDRHVAQAIMACRTEALGGHVRRCEDCGHEETSYNSCRNRHCPKCQGAVEARWVEAREADLLPVEYHHVVLTVPEDLNGLFLGNRRVAYGLLFTAAAKTLQEVALNPKRLGARIGITAILHTWTQTLMYHPHIHCIVPGGGLSTAGDAWVSCRPGFFLPVRVLSRVFRGKLLSLFEQALDTGVLEARPQDNAREHLAEASRKHWVVYSKPPVAGPKQVLKYLGRYTHRIAISNPRLVSMDGGKVTFRWKDRAHGNAPREMTLHAPEFLRRFLLHVVPRGFTRIRHFGIFSNAIRRERIAMCRVFLGASPAPTPDAEAPESWQERLRRLTGKDVTRCQACGSQRIAVHELLPAALQPRAP